MFFTGKKTRSFFFQVEPVLKELGIDTPEQLGYGEPEFFVPEPEYWWEKKWYKDYGYDKHPNIQI